MPTRDIENITGLTEGEKEVLEALVRHGTLTKAAKAIGVSVGLASARKQRALGKYLKAQAIIKEYERYRIRAPTILGV